MCRVVLGDRPIQITLQRALSSLSLWQKLKFFVHIIISQFSTITPEEVEIFQNLKKKSFQFSRKIKTHIFQIDEKIKWKFLGGKMQTARFAGAAASRDG